MASPSSSFGLACWRGGVDPMTIAHTHDDLEFNVAEVEFEYLIDGRTVVVPAGVLAVFWAARPHQLITRAEAGELTWLTVPLVDALGWGLPGGFLTRLFRGEVGVAPAAGPLSLRSRGRHWSEELSASHPLRSVAAREVVAFVFRAAAAVAPSSDAAPAAPALRPDAARMAAWVATHSERDIAVADVAAVVSLHPHHAMTVFRSAMGVTIGDYLAQCRISHAQRLLLTTDRPAAAIGHEVGFGSTSQFYARFRARCGESPAAYRRRRAVSAMRA